MEQTDGSGFAQSKDTLWLYANSRCEDSTRKEGDYLLRLMDFVFHCCSKFYGSARLCPLCLPQW
uniref:Uncharacterized protein n=1 Tax=Wuchereria bancrofti TaxID=6293 RepID=A0AAF5PJW7_WUCBA